MRCVEVLLWRNVSPTTRILSVHSCPVMGKSSFWYSRRCTSRHGMGKDQGVWVLGTTAGLRPAQPNWKPEHNCNQALVRWPLGNLHLFNAELDARQVMASL